MDIQKKIEPYNIIAEDKVCYGYYTVLKTIMNNYISQIESHLYDELGITFQLKYKIETGIKFKDVFNDSKFPLPILIFGMSPLKGDSLILMENRCANFLMQKEELKRSRKIGVSNLFKLEEKNYSDLKNEIDVLLNFFKESWQKITPADAHLKKLVTHRLKAKVMSPLETCVLVSVQFQHKGFQTGWKFCFSGYQLDPILKKYGQKALLIGNGATEQGQNKEYLEEIIEKHTNYELNGVLGEFEISHKDLYESLKLNKVLPVSSGINNFIKLEVNGVPLLSAVAGKTHEKISLQINGKYESIKTEIKKKEKPFLKTNFPNE